MSRTTKFLGLILLIVVAAATTVGITFVGEWFYTLSRTTRVVVTVATTVPAVATWWWILFLSRPAPKPEKSFQEELRGWREKNSKLFQTKEERPAWDGRPEYEVDLGRFREEDR